MAAPGLEYRVRVFTPLARDAPRDAPLEGLARMKAARTSSPGFNEDSFAAVRVALEDTEWAPEGHVFAKKLVILVTDAGPKPPRDPNAESDITATALRNLATELGVGILAIHLRTPDGVPNHDYAARHYEELTTRLGHVFLYPVTGGRDRVRRRDPFHRLKGHDPA